MITAIIIDDEQLSCDLLRKKLNKHCPDVEVVKAFQNPLMALKEIDQLNPDLVFLDIQMPGINGFEFLEKLQHKNFAVIFITAYDQYAIRAIRFSAIDYLLKPVDPEELKQAILRFQQMQKSNNGNQIDFLLKQLKENEVKRIALHTAESIDYVELSDIIRCESASTYTTFYLHSGKKIIVSTNIGEYETMFEPHGFFRVHTSHLINLKFVASYNKADGGQVILKDGTAVDVSRRRKEEFLAAMEKQ